MDINIVGAMWPALDESISRDLGRPIVTSSVLARSFIASSFVNSKTRITLLVSRT